MQTEKKGGKAWGFWAAIRGGERWGLLPRCGSGEKVIKKRREGRAAFQNPCGTPTLSSWGREGQLEQNRVPQNRGGYDFSQKGNEGASWTPRTRDQSQQQISFPTERGEGGRKVQKSSYVR